MNDPPIAELDASLRRSAEQKRWPDYVAALVAKATLTRDPELFVQAARTYTERLMNQTEAIRCHEAALALDGSSWEAITALKVGYEKRRDWEQLIRILLLESDLVDGAERLELRVSAARLAAKRLRKPELCTAVWRKVLECDPANREARAALGQPT
jgi:hypothetical protein